LCTDGIDYTPERLVESFSNIRELNVMDIEMKGVIWDMSSLTRLKNLRMLAARPVLNLGDDVVR
jgi:hypothetical protein